MDWIPYTPPKLKWLEWYGYTLYTSRIKMVPHIYMPDIPTALLILWLKVEHFFRVSSDGPVLCFDSGIEVLLLAAGLDSHGNNMAWWYGGGPSLHHKFQQEWRRIRTAGCIGVHSLRESGCSGMAASKATGFQDGRRCRSLGANAVLTTQQGRHGHQCSDLNWLKLINL